MENILQHHTKRCVRPVREIAKVKIYSGHHNSNGTKNTARFISYPSNSKCRRFFANLNLNPGVGWPVWTKGLKRCHNSIRTNQSSIKPRQIVGCTQSKLFRVWSSCQRKHFLQKYQPDKESYEAGTKAFQSALIQRNTQPNQHPFPSYGLYHPIIPRARHHIQHQPLEKDSKVFFIRKLAHNGLDIQTPKPILSHPSRAQNLQLMETIVLFLFFLPDKMPLQTHSL